MKRKMYGLVISMAAALIMTGWGRPLLFRKKVGLNLQTLKPVHRRIPRGRPRNHCLQGQILSLRMKSHSGLPRRTALLNFVRSSPGRQESK